MERSRKPSAVSNAPEYRAKCEKTFCGLRFVSQLSHKSLFGFAFVLVILHLCDGIFAQCLSQRLYAPHLQKEDEKQMNELSLYFGSIVVYNKSISIFFYISAHKPIHNHSDYHWSSHTCVVSMVYIGRIIRWHRIQVYVCVSARNCWYRGRKAHCDK